MAQFVIEQVELDPLKGASTHDAISLMPATSVWESSKKDTPSIGVYCVSRMERFVDVSVTVKSTLNSPSRFVLLANSKLLGRGASEEFELPAAPANARIAVRFKSPRIGEVGVGMWEELIYWSVRDKIPGLTTPHQFICVIDTPSTPWAPSRNPENEAFQIDLEILKRAVGWAWGARNKADVAALIATRIGALGVAGAMKYEDGQHYVTYPGQDYSKTPVFEIKPLLADLDSKKPALMNCFECSYLEVSLSNLLGARLKCVVLEVPKHLENREFDLGFVRLLGTNALGDPVAPEITAFGYHVVAWEGPLSSEGKVYDGLVQFPDRSGATMKWFTPTAMNYSKYKAILVTRKWVNLLQPTGVQEFAISRN